MPAVRSPLSKSLRFEIFKRDGYRCVYCGITALNAVLHVDHVEPVARGGTNDPSNLVTSCRDCNLGKSAVPLEERKLRAAFVNEEEREHGEQLRAFLAVQREIAGAKREAEELVLERWQDLLGDWPDSLPRQLPRALRDVGLEPVLEAVEVVARNPSLRRPLDQVRYFCGVIRRRREEVAAARATTAAPSREWETGYVDGAMQVLASYWRHRFYQGLGLEDDLTVPDDLFRRIVDDADIRYDDAFVLIDEAIWSTLDEPGSHIENARRRLVTAMDDVKTGRRTVTESNYLFHRTHAGELASQAEQRAIDLASMWRVLCGAPEDPGLLDTTLREMSYDDIERPPEWTQRWIAWASRRPSDTTPQHRLLQMRSAVCADALRNHSNLIEAVRQGLAPREPWMRWKEMRSLLQYLGFDTESIAAIAGAE